MLRNPKTIPVGDTLIEDPLMEPFFISKSQSGGYTVFERVLRGKDNKPYIKTVCYPATFPSALKKVTLELLHAVPGKNYSSIKEYINEWQTISEKVTNLIEN